MGQVGSFIDVILPSPPPDPPPEDGRTSTWQVLEKPLHGFSDQRPVDLVHVELSAR